MLGEQDLGQLVTSGGELVGDFAGGRQLGLLHVVQQARPQDVAGDDPPIDPQLDGRGALCLHV